ncbi:MAG: Zn-ribbon domain-containing OB-fold protein [Deltaproteobacteria bacterium]|nr:Zn-ribbon domain-containing OB-fold protein [Deltaproteobacteria bacterium]
MSDYAKPIPTPSEDSQVYWEATKNHEMKLQQCRRCGAFRFPPGEVCPECTSDEYDWTPVSGKGRVFSFVIYHRAYQRGFADELPYVVAVIELDEGARMLSNVTGCKPEEVRCDMPVEVVYEDITDEVTLPKFRPA